MTVFAIALREAGFRPAVERLREIAGDVLRQSPEAWRLSADAPNAPSHRTALMTAARTALKTSPRNWDGAKDALFQAVRGDAALLWELFEPYRAQAAQRLLTEAASELRDEELAELNRTQQQFGQEDGGGHTVRAHQGNSAPAASRSNAGIAAVNAVARLSLLDTFKINEQPIGDLTPAEANKWAASFERNTRFVRLLTANLPEGQPIRKYRTAEDAAALYAQAQVSDDA